VVGIELITLLSGTDTRYGLPGTDLLHYSLVTNDANVAAGGQVIVDAGQLKAGESFTFDGSAETDGSYRVWGGLGTDVLKGGGGGDIFYFSADRFGAEDRLDGGGGAYNQLSLLGNYTIAFGAEQLVNINAFVFLSGRDLRNPVDYDYAITMQEANIASGVRAIVDAGQLHASETLTFDGSAETDGSFRIFGGKGADSLTGSQGADIILGGLGKDRLDGQGGADVFAYRGAADSTSTGFDTIQGFVFGSDSIDLAGTHDAYEVKTGGPLREASFDADLAAAMAGTLDAMEAVLFTADQGDMAGRLFLIVDQNGTAGYQAGEDFVIELAGTAPPLGPVPDFIV
jgi:Ca2+-binding RTX toxin-like protein